MKRCPNCNRTYTDEALNFCLEDGAPLVGDAPASAEANQAMRYPAPRGSDPPAPEMYQAPPPPQAPPRMNQAPPFQPQWAPMPMAQPRKSNAVWWIFGGLAVIVILGIGIVVVLLAIASITSQRNSNRLISVNTANRNANLNRSNANSTNTSRTNTNSASNLPSSFSDDFSEQKWGTGSSQFGDLSYVNDEYHMRSKDKIYIAMYGPSNDYNTENATVRVTTRSIDGLSPNSGYGLMVHGERSKDDQLEDYTFLIYSGQNPQFKVVQHKGGEETALVPWAASSTIRTGTSPNQLEVRIKGALLSFYINGQYVKSLTDTANFKRGRAGLYTSDAHEVAFDDLAITR